MLKFTDYDFYMSMTRGLCCYDYTTGKSRKVYSNTAEECFVKIDKKRKYFLFQGNRRLKKTDFLPYID